MGIAKRSLLAAATIAGASAIALGAGAGTASARYLGACNGINIRGQGASLQAVAQGLWTADFRATVCTGRAVSYTSSSSGTGLNSWGASGGTATPANSGYDYISSDDAPNTTQIAAIRSAANNADLVVAPVVQAAIAIVANVPSGCNVSSIGNATLQAVYAGTARTWQDLPGGAGDADCLVTINPVVRFDASGTTYQFKQYLYRLNTAAVLGSSTWQDLQRIVGASPTPNETWPGTPIRAASRGGPAVLTAVAGNTGSIGYVNLADWSASARTTTVLNVQNRTTPSVTYASPLSGSNANCASASYTLPAAGDRNVDWSQVYGVNPNVGGTTYSLCALTYEIALAGQRTDRTVDPAGYTLAGFTSGDGSATTVYDYLNYQVGTTGQTTIGSNGYARLTSAVQARSASAIAQIW